MNSGAWPSGNELPNGLILLQVNPDCAAQLDAKARDYGWLYTKGPDNSEVKGGRDER